MNPHTRVYYVIFKVYRIFNIAENEKKRKKKYRYSSNHSIEEKYKARVISITKKLADKVQHNFKSQTHNDKWWMIIYLFFKRVS